MGDPAIIILCFAPIVCALLLSAPMLWSIVYADTRTYLEEYYTSICLARETNNVRACIRRMTKIIDSNNIIWSPNRAAMELANEVFASRLIFSYLTNEEKNLIMEAANAGNSISAVHLVANILERIEAILFFS